MKFNIIHFILLLVVILFFPIVNLALDLFQITYIILFTFISLLIGDSILKNLSIYSSLSFTFTLFSFFTGATLLFGLVLLLNIFNVDVWLWILLPILSLIFIIVFKPSINVFIDKRDLIQLPLFIVLFFLLGWGSESNTVDSSGAMDYTYFTTVVASLNSYPTFETLNEQGSMINYQIFSFLGCAALSKLTGISSHIALWNIWMPFGAILFAFSASSFIKSIALRRTSNLWISLLPVIIFIGLLPLHVKNLINLDLSHLYLPGTGSLLPGGNPPFTFALSVFILTVWLVIKLDLENLKSKRSILVISLLTSMIIGFKVAAFPAAATFIVLVYFFKTNKDYHKSAMLSVLTIIISILIFKFSFVISLATMELRPGYLFRYFGRTNSLNQNLILTLLMMAVYIGIKGLILCYSYFHHAFKDFRWLIISAFSALLASFLIPSLLELKIYNNNGVIIQDVSFDLIQFIRFGFFIITIVASVIVYRILMIKSYKVVSVIIIIHLVMVMTSWVFYISSTEKNANSKRVFLSYKEDVSKNYLDKNKGKLYATFADTDYPSQAFVADDYKFFYVTSNRTEGGYAMTKINIYRWEIMLLLNESLANRNNDVFNLQLDILKKDGVDAIIFNPNNESLLSSENKAMMLPTNSKFVFELKH